MTDFAVTPAGPFSFAGARDHFGGWPEFPPDPAAICMAMPVEGWRESAAVVLRDVEGTVHGEVHGAAAPESAWRQALAAISLDIDAEGFPAVGQRDPAIGRLQARFPGVRPVLFTTPYEAACHFVVGQRISIEQARAIRRRMAAEFGDVVAVEGVTVAAFPRPQVLRDIQAITGLSEEKVARLRGLADAAIEGRLDRGRLRALPAAQARAELAELRGIGPFAAAGTVLRGAGLVDEVSDDPVTAQAVRALYELDHDPSFGELEVLAENWRPFRTWAVVLLHLWFRSGRGGPRPGTFRGGRRAAGR